MIALKARHRSLLCELIKTSFTAPLEVWAYGSRVNGDSHDASDLDLVLRSADSKPLDWQELAGFNQALKDSNIPFLIEARDWANIPDNFRKIILQRYEVLYSSI